MGAGYISDHHVMSASEDSVLHKLRADSDDRGSIPALDRPSLNSAFDQPHGAGWNSADFAMERVDPRHPGLSPIPFQPPY